MAAMTVDLASFQELRKPVWALHFVHHETSERPKSMLAIQLRTDEEPRKEITIRDFVLSTATKPVESVASELM
jgi:hypothetical protein